MESIRLALVIGGGGGGVFTFFYYIDPVLPSLSLAISSALQIPRWDSAA
jgi:hypothetical protein